MLLFDFRIHINHVLREFKTHLSWLGSSAPNNLAISIRYFYVPHSQYHKSNGDSVGDNPFIGLADPLQLEQRQEMSLINNPMFYEWKIPDSELVFCKSKSQMMCPSVASILIIVSVTTTKKTKQKLQQPQNRNKDDEVSDSDTDNGVVGSEVGIKTNHSEEGNNCSYFNSD